MMTNAYLVNLDGTDVRFTPEGKVSVLDAIQALTAQDRPERVWHDLVQANPGITAICETYRFSDTDASVVVDGYGWAIIEELLLIYMIE
jgi:hypothetical protein